MEDEIPILPPGFSYGIVGPWIVSLGPGRWMLTHAIGLPKVEARRRFAHFLLFQGITPSKAGQLAVLEPADGAPVGTYPYVPRCAPLSLN